MRDAQCEPKPVQPHLPIWIGGGGEKVTLRIVAEHADGWNVPFIAPDVWAHKAQVLDAHCDKVGREPATITKSVNVGMAFTDEELRRQFGPMSEYVKPGVLSGSVQEMVDEVGAYVEAAASYVIVAQRARGRRGDRRDVPACDRCGRGRPVLPRARPVALDAPGPPAAEGRRPVGEPHGGTPRASGDRVRARVREPRTGGGRDNRSSAR